MTEETPQIKTMTEETSLTKTESLTREITINLTFDVTVLMVSV